MFRQALILASGLGTRMRPLTDKIPKPMVEICGQSMISRAIDQLHAAGIEKIVITAFYKADLLQEHVLDYIKKKNIDIDIFFVVEDELHEVWGSIKKALPYLRFAPFLLVNGDSYWVDGQTNIIEFMYKSWSSQMKALVLLYPIEKALGYEGRGDFDLRDGLIVSSQAAEFKPYVYIGLQIINPDFLEQEPLAKASIFHIYKKMQYQDIYGAVYDGYWFHVGTPESITETEEFLAEHKLI